MPPTAKASAPGDTATETSAGATAGVTVTAAVAPLPSQGRVMVALPAALAVSLFYGRTK